MCAEHPWIQPILDQLNFPTGDHILTDLAESILIE